MPRRPPYNYVEMGIPIGSELIAKANGEVAVVYDERHVLFRGDVMSITAATKSVTGQKNPRRSNNWFYNGRLLGDIYNETYPWERYHSD